MKPADRHLKINLKFHVNPEILTRVTAERQHDLRENVHILALNNAFYRSATRLLSNHRTGHFLQKIRKIDRRIQQIEHQIKLVRQQATRVQAVLDFFSTKRIFSVIEKIMKIAAKLYQKHHSTFINFAGLRFSAPTALLEWIRCIRDNKICVTKRSDLFEDLAPKVVDPRPMLEVEEFGWFVRWFRRCCLPSTAAY